MADFHKAMAKAIKAKGLQKLKFWCELCHKQCRDANGYKNHCTTEGHLRQVALFSQNANNFIDDYSKQFEKAFMELMRRRWRFVDILAKKAYNEYIQDKEHVHMNATRWVTLTDFVNHLGKDGLCQVRDSDEGLVLRYIDRDPQREAKQKAMREREKEELEIKEIEKKRLLRQVKAFGEQDVENDESAIDPSLEASAPAADPEAASAASAPSNISFSFSISAKKTANKPDPSTTSLSSSLSSSTPEMELSTPETTSREEVKILSVENDKKRPHSDAGEEEPAAKRSKLAPSLNEAPSSFPPTTTVKQPPTSKLQPQGHSLDTIMVEQEKKRELGGRRDYWLHPNIIVKVLNKEVGGGKYYGQKGTVTEVEDKYVAKIKLESGVTLKVDQNDLETVLPALGLQVLIVNGAYRGEKATLQSLNKADYTANVIIVEGLARGRTVTKAYEDISKAV